MRQHTLHHAFVEYLPERLEEGTLYVSMQYATAAHKCCCGCGNDVYTPLSPTDWKLTFDGRTISLFPSLGNWSFPCRSHYWIKNNAIEWARLWTGEEVDAARASDRRSKERQYEEEAKPSIWRRIKTWL